MKVRKLAVAMALAGGLGSGVAQALGLGEIELQSWLNEPLDAEIYLRESRGVDPGDVFVNVAPEAAYERVGINRHQFLSRLKFEVVTGTDGNLVVNVSSREPLREPYLNFLLELTWPNGRLMREYAVLVDPPVYAEDSGVREQVSAPAAAAPAGARQPATRSQESVRRQARAEGSLARGYQAGSFGPTGPSDTLWTIAQQVRPDNSVSTQQVMLALQDQNPNAFIGGNINRLKRGEVLRVPTMEQIQSRSRAQATAAVAQQNQELQSRAVDATRTAEADSARAAGQATPGSDELRLLVADGESRDTEQGGSAGGDGHLPGGTDAGSAIAMEELEATRRENEELNSRLSDLQDQVSTLQRLLELKNTQLAEMQGMTSEEVAAADQAADPSAQDGLTADEADELAELDQAAEEALLSESDGMPAEDELADETVAETFEDISAAEPGVDEADEAEPAVAPAPAAEAPREQPRQPTPIAPPAVEKGFPGNVIDAITNNPMYQIALGGGLVLLLLLLLLVARRNANREKAFYDQLNSEDGADNDSFDLSLDEESAEHEESGDALAEAETYIAYGRHDQAAQVLETAISREPSRTDLRLKLLGVYADNQDRASFEKQFGEIEALDDDTAIAEANALRERLAEAESMPSIDDLESQLRSDSYGSRDSARESAEESAIESAEESTSANTEESSLEDDWELSDDLKADEFEASSEPEIENDFGELESDVAEETDSADDLIEYDLSGLAKGDGAEADPQEKADESDFSSLEMDLDDSEAAKPEEDDLSFDFETVLEDDQPADAGTDVKPETETSLDADEPLSDDVLDESFLDELDAELDKVAGEDEEPDDLDLGESTLDDLELDVSDEDLALMEEFSEAELPTEPEPNETALDEELGLEDALSETEADDELVPLASETLDQKPGQNSALDLDENDLGEEDDFDFLAGTDEAATKLDLARAYIEMGDSDGARDILEEVSLEGDDEQKAEAQELLKNLS